MWVKRMQLEGMAHKETRKALAYLINIGLAVLGVKSRGLFTMKRPSLGQFDK